MSLSMLLIFLSSCEKLIKVDNPRTQLVKEAVFEDDLTATAAVIGLYHGLTNVSGGFNSVTYLTSFSADEMIIGGTGEISEFYQNQVLPTNTNINSLWNSAYAEIYKANLILEGLTTAPNISPSLKNQLIGEAKFFRAFHHFYLLNLFGEVPYLNSTDYKINSLASRTSIVELYEYITSDLLDSKGLLAEDYAYSNGDRVRLNKWAATAMLARVYLYKQQWALAEEQAEIVIEKKSLYTLSPLDKTFLKNSSEAIWQLVPPNNLLYTLEGGVFITPIYNATVGVMSERLFTIFEPSDNRRSEWVKSEANMTTTWHYPVKYKENSDNGSGREYALVLRLAEMYLIRAEARARLNKLSGANGAAADLNMIRIRAGLPGLIAVTQTEILAAVAQERRVELFTEWGHRWMDLKRTGNATGVLKSIKPNWSDADLLYPVPFSEWQLNPNLGQNPGY